MSGASRDSGGRTPRAGSGPPTSSPFDRIGRPGVSRHGHRDGLGKEALYSTAPTAAPTRPVEARCRRCSVPLGLTVREVARLVVPPFLLDPLRWRLWTRCPACDRYSWLDLRAGQALRVLLDREPQGP